MNENQLFQECIDQAKIALTEKEVAIGCVFFHDGLNRVIARSRNSVNATKNATRHAEMNCIDQVVELCLKDNELNLDDIWASIVVYVTCEPCVMCSRILRHLAVKRVLYGCFNPRFGGCSSVLQLATSQKIKYKPLLAVGGYRDQETIQLLKIFYAGENLNAPEEFRKVKKHRVDNNREEGSSEITLESS